MKRSIKAIKKAIVLAVAIGVAWSNFWHPSKRHAASVRIGANVHSSSCVGARKSAYAEAWRPPFTTVNYHYRFC